MEYKTRTVTQHTVTFANGVTVTREDLAGLMLTAGVQIENSKVKLSCLQKEMDAEMDTLDGLVKDLAALQTLNGVAK